jgi:hypothetical protein
MKTGSLVGVAILAAFITYCLRQPAARTRPSRAGARVPEPLPDRDGETEPTMASPAALTPGSAPSSAYPPYHEADPSVRH